MKKTLIAVVKLVLPIALFAYLLYSVDAADYEAFWQQPKRWELLFAAQALVLIAIVASFIRWQLLVRAFEIPFTTTEALRLGFLGYLLNFVSFGSVGGDLFKAILVARNKPEKRPEAVASVLLDRAIGLLGLVILACFSLSVFAEAPLSPLLFGIRRAAAAITIVAIFCLLLAIYGGRWFDVLINQVERIKWVGETAARMARAVRLLRKSPSTLPTILIASVCIHAMLATSIYLISAGTYSQHPSLSEHLSIVPPGMAAGALPLAPGGLGLQEGALAGLFAQLKNLPENFSGILVATIYRLVTITIAGIGLVYYLFSQRRDFEYVAKHESD